MPDPTPNVPRDLRTEYSLDQLDEREVLPDAIVQFERWFKDAQLANVFEPNAMTVATADGSGAPSARVCLLKGVDQRGFFFYTNYDSRKGRELAANPRVALCFYWQPLERQVRVEGFVEKTSREESEAYFHTRPVGSQIGAWVSHQSETIGSRAELDQRAAELMAKFKVGPVPLPPNWGGYRVVPQAIEFWQGRPNRLHDRLRYTREASGGWTIQRLAP